MNKEVSRWRATDQDGSTIILSRLGYEDVMVEWSHDHWDCSECGPQRSMGTGAPAACDHAMAAGRHVPLAVALAMVGAFAKPPKPVKQYGRTREDAAIEQGVAQSLAKGAPQRAARVADRDEDYRRITAPVTTRVMTDEDRLKLEAARQRKSRAFQTMA